MSDRVNQATASVIRPRVRVASFRQVDADLLTWRRRGYDGA